MLWALCEVNRGLRSLVKDILYIITFKIIDLSRHLICRSYAARAVNTLGGRDRSQFGSTSRSYAIAQMQTAGVMDSIALQSRM